MTEPTSIRRPGIVASARLWIGTPYHHQASTLRVGVDCIGLVRGVYRQLYGREPEALPAYRHDWAEATGEEALIEAARRHLDEIEPVDLTAGDIAIFRYRPRSVAKHAGIIASEPDVPANPSLTIIHAVERQPVAEIALTSWWRRRIAAAFRFRGVID